MTTTSSSADAVLATVHGMATGVLAMAPLLTAGLVVFLIFWAIATAVRGTVEKIAKQRSEFPSAAKAFGRLAYIALMLLGVLIAVTVAFPSTTPAKLFSALGIGGVAIGFAFKDILQNFLAGILLLIRHPFRAGDEITTGAFTGTLESIETRATFIRTYDGQRIIVPNSVIYTEVVTVITACPGIGGVARIELFLRPGDLERRADGGVEVARERQRGRARRQGSRYTPHGRPPGSAKADGRSRRPRRNRPECP